MLLDFNFSNYRSFKDEQSFSMERDDKLDFKKNSILFDGPSGPDKITRVAGFYGANAAGKSNFLKALLYAKALIVLDEIWQDNYISMENEPSKFEMSFVADNNLKYNYHFEILGNTCVAESLYVYKTSKPTKIFEYSERDGIFDISNTFESDEKTAIKFNFEKSRNRLIIQQFRDSKNAEAKAAYDFFAHDLTLSALDSANKDELQSRLTNAISNDDEIHNFINDALSAADLGIKSVDLVESSSGANQEQIKLFSKFIVDFQKAGNSEMTDEEIQKLEEMPELPNKIMRTIFEHEIDGVKTKFNIDSESKGTMAACSILLDLLPVLKKGKVYIVDELDKSLHPTIVAQIIDIFNSAETNPNNAQLIFSTHDVSLLDSTIYGEDILDRDEVWFVEKSNEGCSQIFALTDIKYTTRKDDNIYKKYVGGVYGATPRVSLPYIVGLYWEKQKNESAK